MTKVLITGASSFVGMHLAVGLAARGFRVTATLRSAREDYDGIRAKRIARLEAAGVHLGWLDLCVASAIDRLVVEETPDVWVQHAGWAEDYGSPDYDLATAHRVNVEPLATVYAALEGTDCRGVLVTGSSMEYGDTDRACEETDVCLPETAYGLSKLCATLRARQLAIRHGLPTRVARVFIPFGPLDLDAKLIPAALDALRQGRTIDLSACTQARDFVHVDDLVRGYEALIEDLKRDRMFEIFNLCGGVPTPLKALLLQMAEVSGTDAGLLRFGRLPMRPGEPAISYGSNAKARRVLGWQPRPLSDALAGFVAADRSLSQTRQGIGGGGA